MALFDLIIALVFVGLALWLINTYVPMEPGIKRLMNIAVVVILVFWILQGLGLFGTLRSIRIN